jgi:hypothetical protein
LKFLHILLRNPPLGKAVFTYLIIKKSASAPGYQHYPALLTAPYLYNDVKKWYFSVLNYAKFTKITSKSLCFPVKAYCPNYNCNVKFKLSG